MDKQQKENGFFYRIHVNRLLENNDGTCSETCRYVHNVSQFFSKLQRAAVTPCYTELVLCRYVKRGHLFTKGYLFLIFNCLTFFYSLPITDILLAIIMGSSDNSTKHFPFVALYSESCYHFPMYEVRQKERAFFRFIYKLL